MRGRVTMPQEVAVGDELAALAIAGLTTIATLVALIVAALQAPQVD